MQFIRSSKPLWPLLPTKSVICSSRLSLCNLHCSTIYVAWEDGNVYIYHNVFTFFFSKLPILLSQKPEAMSLHLPNQLYKSIMLCSSKILWAHSTSKLTLNHLSTCHGFLLVYFAFLHQLFFLSLHDLDMNLWKVNLHGPNLKCLFFVH